MGGRKPASSGLATSPQHEAAEMSLELLISTAQAALRAQRLARRQGAPLPECIGDDETIAITPQQNLTYLALHATRAVATAAAVCFPAFQRASRTATGLATTSTFPPPPSAQGTAHTQGPSARTQRRISQRHKARGRVEERNHPPAATGFFTTTSLKPAVVPGGKFTFGNVSGQVQPRDFSLAAPPSGRSGAVSDFSSFSDVVRTSTAGQPPSPGEKRSGKPTSVPPSPPRIGKKGKAAEQPGTPADEDIADLEYDDPWHEADGLATDVHDSVHLGSCAACLLP
ncbi:hypothetical protein CYMTET_29061 [Cymbomonas tetramitiformis]|uniref:Uncharacterized protein n=1 Tax=Cymbomonas tetramitiformis TaxID=36881 RepID=A0AAE0FM06_9CHLO|nr:hypothetical protein CYMTET_29061 [Cymbomonas tetramitiformis]